MIPDTKFKRTERTEEKHLEEHWEGDYIYQLLLIPALFGAKVPTTGLQGHVSAQELDIELLVKQFLLTLQAAGEREENCAYYTYNIIVPNETNENWFQENVGGKNANKCSLWRLHDFFLCLVHSLFIHYPNCIGA